MAALPLASKIMGNGESPSWSFTACLAWATIGPVTPAYGVKTA